MPCCALASSDSWNLLESYSNVTEGVTNGFWVNFWYFVFAEAQNKVCGPSLDLREFLPSWLSWSRVSSVTFRQCRNANQIYIYIYIINRKMKRTKLGASRILLFGAFLKPQGIMMLWNLSKRILKLQPHCKTFDCLHNLHSW